MTRHSHLFAILCVLFLAAGALAVQAGEPEQATDKVDAAFQPATDVTCTCSDDNPAAKYCTTLGYKCVTTGADCNCVFPDGSSCEIWAFFRGTCGQSHSFCETQAEGNTIVRRMDNMGTWCAEYAVCVFPEGFECAEYDYYQGQCKPGDCQSWILSKGGCVNCDFD